MAKVYWDGTKEERDEHVARYKERVWSVALAMLQNPKITTGIRWITKSDGTRHPELVVDGADPRDVNECWGCVLAELVDDIDDSAYYASDDAFADMPLEKSEDSA